MNAQAADEENQVVSDHWKAQYEESQRELKQYEIDKRVLEKKNQRLEEKCEKLEAQLTTMQEIASSSQELDRLTRVIQEQE